jgi:hypothetical protein
LSNIERGALFAALLGRLAQVNVLTQGNRINML